MSLFISLLFVKKFWRPEKELFHARFLTQFRNSFTNIFPVVNCYTNSF